MAAAEVMEYAAHWLGCHAPHVACAKPQAHRKEVLHLHCAAHVHVCRSVHWASCARDHTVYAWVCKVAWVHGVHGLEVRRTDRRLVCPEATPSHGVFCVF